MEAKHKSKKLQTLEYQPAKQLKTQKSKPAWSE
jgi:hypothetical protein